MKNKNDLVSTHERVGLRSIEILAANYKQKLSDLFHVTDLKRIKATNRGRDVRAQELCELQNYVEKSYGKEFKIEWYNKQQRANK